MALGWRESYIRYREFFLNITALYKKRADLRAFLEIILSFSAIIIFLLFALKPTAITIVNLLQQIKEKQATLAALTQKVNNLQTASGILQQNQNFIPDIETAVPNIPKPEILSQQIEGLAAKDSVEILGISTSQIPLVGTSGASKSQSGVKALPGNAKEMPFSLSIKGSYINLASFLSDFENLRVVSRIDNLGLTASTTNEGLSIVATITGRAPFLGN